MISARFYEFIYPPDATCFAAGSSSHIPRHRRGGQTRKIPGDHLLIHNPQTHISISASYPPLLRGIVH